MVRFARHCPDGRRRRSAVACQDQSDGSEGDDTDAERPEEAPAARSASVTEHGRMYSTAGSGPLAAAANLPR
jgi:hypothetical protein